MTHFEVLVAGGAATLAALAYIARQLRGVATLITFMAKLPAEHAYLMTATDANTVAIAALTVQLSALTSDVAMINRR